MALGLPPNLRLPTYAVAEDLADLLNFPTEHMESDESDGSFPPWVSLEYSQMLLLAAPSNVIFSSLSPASVDSLKELLEKKGAKAASYRNETKSVRELMEAEGVPLERVCLLDPRAEKEIGTDDRESFDWFL